MEALIPIIAILAVFGSPVVIVKEILAHRERRQKLALGQSLAAQKALPAGGEELAQLKAERKVLLERVENLEAIVCGVDFELNQKLSKLIDEQRLLAESTIGKSPLAAGAAAAPATRAAPAKNNLATDRTATVGTRVPSTSAQTLSPGDVLANRYRVERLLGRGGMGAVYLAHDEVLDDTVAVKVIAAAFAADEASLVERFRREAAAARKVSSPSVIRIHDLGEARPGLLYLSMEYFPGRTLAEVITTRGLVPISDCVDYLQQICTGLAAAHDAGVIHRDLKPQNVLVGERNTVKLIDFGLAKATTGAGLTGTGMLLGTPHYMSPEQVRGKNVDASSDLYSLGALAYHLVTGRPPFAGDNVIAVGFAHCTETAPAPRTLRPDLPESLDAMIVKSLAKLPTDRPRTALEFRTALV
ncbi:MAG TPA: serine/threonine-protein kinase [Kofleriaceae bacterium]|nr:serine/threonine-protein kinase [Kofleriaceae bacterium]